MSPAGQTQTAGLNATKIQITAVCSRRFIHVMDVRLCLNSCCFDGSHLAVQVDPLHEADRRELHNLFLVQHTNTPKIAQDNYISSRGINEAK